MKYMIISDTHGKIQQAAQIFREVSDFDGMIHLGDLHGDALQLGDILGIEVISVKGNMDGALPQETSRIFETEAGSVYLTHGHREEVKSNLQRLLYRAEEQGCRAAFFGHTHEPFYGDYDGILLFNPGSLTLPKDAKRPSYGILDTTNGELRLSIVYRQWTENAGNPPRKNPIEGGYLKNLLNNSDRF